MRLATAGLLCVAALSTNRIGAQQVPNRATAYLFPTDVRDPRAVWVNPAGLGVLRDASIYAELSVGDPGARGRLRQINAGFNSRGLSLAYQRDLFDAGIRGSTLRLGIAGGSQGLAAGVAVARYGGTGITSTGWDVGVTYVAMPGLTVGAVAANLGQPLVGGQRQRIALAPGLTWHPAPIRALAVSTVAHVTAHAEPSYAFGVAWRTPGTSSRWPIEIIARLDTDGGLRRSAFALALSIGGQNRFGAVITTPGDASHIDAASVYGVVTRQPAAGR
ncbi:MAG TPA: hypothetical protein VEK83_05935 [Gemmatimonadales bacterium]|nr:hypothetical protein [Gemmatimonadales bacterium]